MQSNIKMPDIFSYFSPRKLLSPLPMSPPGVSPGKRDALNTAADDRDDDHQDKVVDEADVAGILNENYADNCCGHAIDLSSVESLSVALLKLESEKVSYNSYVCVLFQIVVYFIMISSLQVTLETEISHTYDRITLADLENIVNRIISVSKVEFAGGESSDEEEVGETFDLLKSTALFVEKRLRRVREKSQRKAFERKIELLADSDVQEHDTASVEIETVDNVLEFLTESLANQDLNTPNVEKCDSASLKEEARNYNNVRLCPDDVDFPDVGDQIDNDDKTNIAEGGDEETDSLEEKISVNSDELANSDDKGSPKRRFGHEKNRWSIRRVFKKKSA